MLIRPPAVDFPRKDGALARRLPSLRGARIAFVDGWGRKLPDGSVGMYPTMDELARLLRDREQIDSVTWIHKDSVSRPEAPESVDRLVKVADAVINGEGL